jgi:hypothetical protein
MLPWPRLAGTHATSAGRGSAGTATSKTSNATSCLTRCSLICEDPVSDDKGGPATSDTADQIKLAEERLDQTQDHLDKVQAVLDDVRRVLIAAEKVEAAVERARSGLRTAEVVVVAGAIALVVLAVVSRRGR